MLSDKKEFRILLFWSGLSKMLSAAGADRPALIRNIAKSFAVFSIFASLAQLMKISEKILNLKLMIV